MAEASQTKLWCEQIWDKPGVACPSNYAVWREVGPSVVDSGDPRLRPSIGRRCALKPAAKPRKSRKK